MMQSTLNICLTITITNGLIKVRRRWEQRHPQGANSGSNGKLELMPNSKWLPPKHEVPVAIESTSLQSNKIVSIETNSMLEIIQPSLPAYMQGLTHNWTE
jgi:hypothetical protein